MVAASFVSFERIDLSGLKFSTPRGFLETASAKDHGDLDFSDAILAGTAIYANRSYTLRVEGSNISNLRIFGGAQVRLGPGNYFVKGNPPYIEAVPAPKNVMVCSPGVVPERIPGRSYRGCKSADANDFTPATTTLERLMDDDRLIARVSPYLVRGEGGGDLFEKSSLVFSPPAETTIWGEGPRSKPPNSVRLVAELYAGMFADKSYDLYGGTRTFLPAWSATLGQSYYQFAGGDGDGLDSLLPTTPSAESAQQRGGAEQLWLTSDRDWVDMVVSQGPRVERNAQLVPDHSLPSPKLWPRRPIVLRPINLLAASD